MRSLPGHDPAPASGVAAVDAPAGAETHESAVAAFPGDMDGMGGPHGEGAAQARDGTDTDVAHGIQGGADTDVAHGIQGGADTDVADGGTDADMADVADSGAGADVADGSAEAETSIGVEQLSRRARRRARRLRRRERRPRWWRRTRLVLAALLAVFVILVGVSAGTAMTNPALGGSVGARLAEWARDHGGASFVNWIENEWYSHHAPKVGGAPPKGAIRKPPPSTTTSTAPVTTEPPHLTSPAPIEPFATPAIAGEGDWSPVGRTVGGIPAVFETTLRPDAQHTSYVVGVAWMDTKLLSATLYSGSQIPGGGPYTNTAPIQPAAARNLVAAFNAGFLMSQANGGYYTDGRTEIPLRTGAASFVVYKDGSATVGQWGRDVSMSSDVVSVRQNLDLLVDNGQPAAGLDSTTTSKWGFTLGNAVYVWRSGLGVTADGALVYVGGPGLNITDLADILARAGAVRAMELDINTTWVNYATYAPSTPTGPAVPTNGTELLPQMAGGAGRYFQSWWARDFITMSAVPVTRAGG